MFHPTVEPGPNLQTKIVSCVIPAFAHLRHPRCCKAISMFPSIGMFLKVKFLNDRSLRNSQSVSPLKVAESDFGSFITAHPIVLSEFQRNIGVKLADHVLENVILRRPTPQSVVWFTIIGYLQ
jgi:hypothetical protein